MFSCEENLIHPFAMTNEKVFVRLSETDGEESNYRFVVSLSWNFFIDEIDVNLENSFVFKWQTALKKDFYISFHYSLFCSFLIQQRFWPDLESATYCGSDLQIAYSYIFLLGIPPGLLGQV